MKHQIQNDHLTVCIDTLGAELQNLIHRKSGLEYMWGADPAFWSKKSPVLFPIVGALKENRYSHEGKSYSLNRHGFARESEFAVSEKGEDFIVFTLCDTEATLKCYPFHFNFSIRYSLERNQLKVTYLVKNTGEKSLLFSVGAHPAFKVPFAPETNFNDYRLEFSQAETEVSWLLTPEGLVENKSIPLLDKTDRLPLLKSLFYNGALVFKHLASNSIALVSDKTPHGLRMHFDGFPFFGIWNAKDANFVCIEPWCGIGDSVSSSGILSEKEGLCTLPASQIFERTWIVELF